MKRTFIFLLISAGIVLPARAEVRVLLFQTQTLQYFSLSSARGARVFSLGSSACLFTLAPGETARIDLKNNFLCFQGRTSLQYNQPVKILPANPAFPLRLSTPATSAREYEGSLEVYPDPSALRVINIVPEESYCASVVAREIPRDWPGEMLKVQAVLARTYLAAHHNRHQSQKAEMCDLTHCQVFQGRIADLRVINAVRATRGWILTYQGKPIDAVFHSTCGGKTSAAQTVWSNDYKTPYLTSISDIPFCQASPYSLWTFDAPCEMLESRLKISGVPFPVPLQTLRVQQTDSAGRVLRLQLVLRDESVIPITADELYRAWGKGGHWHQIKSTWFTLEKRGKSFHFQGRGLGHGVGLCQWGARGRALAGWNYRDISAFYFPNTSLEPVITPNEN